MWFKLKLLVLFLLFAIAFNSLTSAQFGRSRGYGFDRRDIDDYSVAGGGGGRGLPRRGSGLYQGGAGIRGFSGGRRGYGFNRDIGQ